MTIIRYSEIPDYSEKVTSSPDTLTAKEIPASDELDNDEWWELNKADIISKMEIEEVDIDENVDPENDNEIPIVTVQSLIHIESKDEYIARTKKEEPINSVEYSNPEEAILYKRLHEIDNEIELLEEQLVSIRVFGN